jgi:hypothetical protein
MQANSLGMKLSAASFPLGYNSENYQLKISELLLDIKIHNTKLKKVFGLGNLNSENGMISPITTGLFNRQKWLLIKMVAK